MNSVYDSVAAIGMDVHYKFSTVSMRDRQGKVVRREKLDHRDRVQLRKVLSGWPAGVPAVMEASFGWGWIADAMKDAGLNPRLSNCYKVEQMRKARGLAKTNKKDADLLSLLPFETGDWWKVWMATKDVRDRREWMRYRAGLVSVQTQTKNRISALFHRQGIIHDLSDLFGVAGRKLLAELGSDGRLGEVELMPGALTCLRGLTELLDQVRGRLAKIAWQLRGQLERDPLARRLDGIPGFGLILSHLLKAEIGVIERFRHHRALAAYSLLAPISDDTGEDDGSKPIGRHLGCRGNATLKWAFLEAAHGAVKTGGKWRRIFDSATEGGTKNRGRGYIKVARELVKVVYVVWRKGVEYTDTPPARPGWQPGGLPRERMKNFLSSTRSGTGQPLHPMAVVH